MLSIKRWISKSILWLWEHLGKVRFKEIHKQVRNDLKPEIESKQTLLIDNRDIEVMFQIYVANDNSLEYHSDRVICSVSDYVLAKSDFGEEIPEWWSEYKDLILYIELDNWILTNCIDVRDIGALLIRIYTRMISKKYLTHKKKSA